MTQRRLTYGNWVPIPIIIVNQGGGSLLRLRLEMSSTASQVNYERTLDLQTRQSIGSERLPLLLGMLCQSTFRFLLTLTL